MLTMNTEVPTLYKDSNKADNPFQYFRHFKDSVYLTLKF